MSPGLTPVLCGCGLAGLLVAARLALWPLAPIELPAAAATPGAPAAPTLAAVSDSPGPSVAAQDPFRLTHHPAGVAYDPLRLTEPPAPPIPRPALALIGVVSGRVPTAVIAGFPGVDGPRVVRVGDVISGIRVKAITLGAARLAGLDTVWALNLKEPE
jgi:hypothetical protein